MKYKSTNIVTKGLSGKVGGLVYYQRWGKTFVRKAPGNYNKIATALQAPGRELLAAAVSFAKSIIADPQLKLEYQQRSKPNHDAYRTAIVEYMAAHRLPSNRDE